MIKTIASYGGKSHALIQVFDVFSGADPNIEIRSKTMAKFAVSRQDVELMELLVVSRTNLTTAKEDPEKFYRSHPCLVTLVERSLRNPLKLQHLCRQAIVKCTANVSRSRARCFSGMLDKTGAAIFSRIGLPPAAVDFLEFKSICLAHPGNGDFFH